MGNKVERKNVSVDSCLEPLASAHSRTPVEYKMVILQPPAGRGWKGGTIDGVPQRSDLRLWTSGSLCTTCPPTPPQRDGTEVYVKGSWSLFFLEEKQNHILLRERPHFLSGLDKTVELKIPLLLTFSERLIMGSRPERWRETEIELVV